MVDKKYRTKETYMDAGAAMRLLKAAGSKVADEVGKVLSAKDNDKLLKALRVIDEVCSKAEDSMFSDHPELTDDALDVFYGTLDIESRNETDAHVKAKAKEMADGFFA